MTLKRTRMANPPSPGLLSGLKLPGCFPKWGTIPEADVNRFRSAMEAIIEAADDPGDMEID